MRDWNIQGLPSDAFSTENGVIVTRGNRSVCVAQNVGLITLITIFVPFGFGRVHCMKPVIYCKFISFPSLKMATDGGPSRPSSEMDQEYGNEKSK